MKQHNRIPAAAPQEICGRAEAANAAAVADLRRLVGDGAGHPDYFRKRSRRMAGEHSPERDEVSARSLRDPP